MVSRNVFISLDLHIGDGYHQIAPVLSKEKGLFFFLRFTPHLYLVYFFLSCAEERFSKREWMPPAIMGKT
ncbi:hypothetical protein D8X75_04675 [Vibrio cholerae]|nr:hypothetical protein [Vibrio cholerae]EGR1426965.1 hypothetical protein [Vibrio cholerae]PAR73680.1 hypothetical protein CGT87_18080 [Vibrio cholerae]